MNAIKKYLGLIWMAIAILSYVVLFQTAMEKIEAKPTADTIIEWSIFAIIFLPIAIGLLIFGWLAWKGDYSQLPLSSEEIED